jgi:hypothetical protein
MTTTLSFSVPESDAREFSGLPAEARTRVHWFLAVFRSIASATAKTKACAAVAESAEIHFNTVYNTWKAFVRTGDWRVCLDKRKTPEFWKRDTSKAIGLPHEFTEFWKDLCEDNQRAFKPAHRLLRLQYRRWRNGDQTQAVPGYPFCPPPAPGSSLPRGWNYSNLLHHVPNEIELAAARGGRTAALKLMPGVLTTRIGSYPFAEVQFDDMWHDFEVNVPGQKSACRLLEFGAVDTFTTFLFRPGLKPRLRNMDTGKAQVLNSRDFHLYLINWLLDFGAHPNGTVLMMENGTAAVSKEFREKLMSWLPQLTIETGGMSGAPAFAGAWRERGKGNPNAKSLKEGLGKLIHNQLAHLPGQIGMNRENLPAGHFGRSRENDTLLAIAAQLPALTNQIQLGFLSLQDAVYAINEIYDLLNCRDDHKIEGWSEIGGVVDSFRFSAQSDDWRGMEEIERLPEHERQLLAMALRLDPSLRKPRVLSPAEMLLAHSPRLIKPPHESIPDLLGAAYGDTKDVVGGEIGFTRPDTGKLRFYASYQDADGFLRRIPNGTSVLCHLNPWKTEHLYLSDPSTGRFLGLADRQHAATRGDTDAIQAQHARAQHDYKEALHGLVRRQGLARVPNLKANAATFRKANTPSARDRAVAASFDSSELLENGDMESCEISHTDPAINFDPSDLL